MIFLELFGWHYGLFYIRSAISSGWRISKQDTTWIFGTFEKPIVVLKSRKFHTQPLNQSVVGQRPIRSEILIRSESTWHYFLQIYDHSSVKECEFCEKECHRNSENTEISPNRIRISEGSHVIECSLLLSPTKSGVALMATSNSRAPKPKQPLDSKCRQSTTTTKKKADTAESTGVRGKKSISIWAA